MSMHPALQNIPADAEHVVINVKILPLDPPASPADKLAALQQATFALARVVVQMPELPAATAQLVLDTMMGLIVAQGEYRDAPPALQ